MNHKASLERQCPYLSSGTLDLKSVHPLGHSCLVKIKGPLRLVRKLSDTSISSSLALVHHSAWCTQPLKNYNFHWPTVCCFVMNKLNVYVYRKCLPSVFGFSDGLWWWTMPIANRTTTFYDKRVIKESNKGLLRAWFNLTQAKKSKSVKNSMMMNYLSTCDIS